MKRKVTAAILAAILSFSLLAGCGGSGQSEPAEKQTETEGAAQDKGSTAEDSSDAGTGAAGQDVAKTDSNIKGDISGGSGSTQENPGTGVSQENPGTGATQENPGTGDTGSSGGSTLIGGLNDSGRSAGFSDTTTQPGEIPFGESMEGAAYVLMYDPLIYDENDPGQMTLVTSLDTGDISTQIDVSMTRADEMELEVPVLLSQAELNAGIEGKDLDRSGDKAEGMAPIYSKGDTHDFYCWASDLNMQNRTLETFVCVYEGENCYVWSWNDSVSEEQAAELGTEFDTNIYQKDVDTFGTGRFTDEDGKVNILMYPMQKGMGGFFTMLDLLAEGEMSPEMAEQYHPNYDHAIINVNSDMLEDMAFVKSTLAHEFQHLICASEYFYFDGTPIMRTWLNEAMSAYAEENVYPGIKDQGYYNQMMYLSNAYRTGQSLYNFSTKDDEYIGAYGAVYLFSQYMDQTAGKDVFTKVHEFWRSSFDPSITEAKALASSVPESFYQGVDQAYDYPEQLSTFFTCPEEEWMSKMTLSFYMETLSGKLAHLEEFEEALHAYTLYNEVNPQLIQGGGRMLVKTLDGNFVVPDSADPGLVYIGLDENFKPIEGKIFIGK